MRESRDSAPPPVLRDARGRVIEVGAPCDVFWEGGWHRGRVERVLRKRIQVIVYPWSMGPPHHSLVPPHSLGVLGPTYEDVGKESAARAAARAEGARFLPEPDPDPDG